MRDPLSPPVLQKVISVKFVDIYINILALYMYSVNALQS